MFLLRRIKPERNAPPPLSQQALPEIEIQPPTPSSPLSRKDSNASVGSQASRRSTSSTLASTASVSSRRARQLAGWVGDRTRQVSELARSRSWSVSSGYTSKRHKAPKSYKDLQDGRDAVGAASIGRGGRSAASWYKENVESQRTSGKAAGVFGNGDGEGDDIAEGGAPAAQRRTRPISAKSTWPPWEEREALRSGPRATTLRNNCSIEISPHKDSDETSAASYSYSTEPSSQVGSTEGADTHKSTSTVLEESNDAVVGSLSYGPVDDISLADQRLSLELLGVVPSLPSLDSGRASGSLYRDSSPLALAAEMEPPVISMPTIIGAVTSHVREIEDEEADYSEAGLSRITEVTEPTATEDDSFVEMIERNLLVEGGQDNSFDCDDSHLPSGSPATSPYSCSALLSALAGTPNELEGGSVSIADASVVSYPRSTSAADTTDSSQLSSLGPVLPTNNAFTLGDTSACDLLYIARVQDSSSPTRSYEGYSLSVFEGYNDDEEAPASLHSPSIARGPVASLTSDAGPPVEASDKSLQEIEVATLARHPFVFPSPQLRLRDPSPSPSPSPYKSADHQVEEQRFILRPLLELEVKPLATPIRNTTLNRASRPRRSSYPPLDSARAAYHDLASRHPELDLSSEFDNSGEPSMTESSSGFPRPVPRPRFDLEDTFLSAGSLQGGWLSPGLDADESAAYISPAPSDLSFDVEDFMKDVRAFSTPSRHETALRKTLAQPLSSPTASPTTTGIAADTNVDALARKGEQLLNKIRAGMVTWGSDLDSTDDDSSPLRHRRHSMEGSSYASSLSLDLGRTSNAPSGMLFPERGLYVRQGVPSPESSVNQKSAVASSSLSSLPIRLTPLRMESNKRLEKTKRPNSPKISSPLAKGTGFSSPESPDELSSAPHGKENRRPPEPKSPTKFTSQGSLIPRLTTRQPLGNLPTDRSPFPALPRPIPPTPSTPAYKHSLVSSSSESSGPVSDALSPTGAALMERARTKREQRSAPKGTRGRFLARVRGG